MTTANEREWDISLNIKSGDNLQPTLPSVIGRALKAKGYNRARLSITEEGLLLVPYAASSEVERGLRAVDLPDWNGAA